MVEQRKLKCVVVPAWWLRWWLAGLIFFCRASQREPDWERVEAMIERGLKVKVVRQ